MADISKDIQLLSDTQTGRAARPIMVTAFTDMSGNLLDNLSSSISEAKSSALQLISKTDALLTLIKETVDN